MNMNIILKRTKHFIFNKNQIFLDRKKLCNFLTSLVSENVQEV